MELATFLLKRFFFRCSVGLGQIALLSVWLFAIRARALQLVQPFCSNKPFHFEGVEYPPIKAAQLVLEQRACFLRLPYSGTLAWSVLRVFPRSLPAPSSPWRARTSTALRIGEISFC